jgi:hypothetical protein
MSDVALGVRLAEAGHRIVLDPAIQGTHLKRWTLKRMVYTDFVLRGVPWVRLILRRGEPPAHLNLGWRHRISALVSLLGVVSVMTRRGGLGAVMAAALVGLNRPFYALLLKRRGAVEATLGIGVHAIHHVTSLASLLTGVAIHVTEWVERPREYRAAGSFDVSAGERHPTDERARLAVG